MPHDISLIATITAGFVLAFAFGFLAHRFRLPPLVGYLLAGVAIGPFTPGFVADGGLAGQLAEIGVILLMFGVGLHFSVADLMAVRRIAIPGAVGQIALATLVTLGLTKLWGWPLGAGLVLGLSLSVASTVVLLKALEGRNAVGTPNGRIAVGWLIVEDLAMVLALVTLPAVAELLGGKLPATPGHPPAESGSLLVSLGLTLVKVAAFVALVMTIGPRVLPWLLRQVARTGSRELFTLSVLAIALGVALGSAKLFGVSFALGAFFAGMVLNESELSHKAAHETLPLQDAFAVLFFVSVGMLFDPSILVREPLKVAAVLGVIILGKSLIALLIVLVLRFPLSSAFSVSGALAQIGEFSFILAGLGVSYQLLPPEGLNLVLAGAILSITLNPVVFHASERLAHWAARSGQALEQAGARQFAALQEELERARELAEQAAAAHRTFTPEELVERFPLFASLTPAQREVLILHFHPIAAEPGDRLIRVGDAADAVYFISSGEVEVAVGGRRIKLTGGDFFGEMALISGQPRSADVTAVDYTKLLALDRRDFRAFVRKHPEIREEVAHLAAQRQKMNAAEAGAEGKAASGDKDEARGE
ncbi:MAG: cation:proton antiporter [Verrucomicrobia bacterium]|nr:cation:proton antiporter [Verrucomicrobiota bacterium]